MLMVEPVVVPPPQPPGGGGGVVPLLSDLEQEATISRNKAAVAIRKRLRFIYEV
jgi:hypothetical protein